MRQFIAHVSIFLLALGLSGGPQAQEWGNAKSDTSAFSKLQHQAKRNGMVSVIVALKAPNLDRAQTSGWRNLGDYIQEVQLQAKQELGWVNFNDLVEFKHAPAMAMSVTPQRLQELRQSSSVETIIEDIPVELFLSKSIPLIGATTSKLSIAKTKTVQQGKGKAVVIIDSGVDSNHPYLKGRVIAESCITSPESTDKVASLCPNGKKLQKGKGAARPCDMKLPGLSGTCPHGTHVAGIAAGRGANNHGVAPAASIIAIKLGYVAKGSSCGSNGYCLRFRSRDWMMALDQVLDMAANYPIAAVNLSLGGGRNFNTCSNHPATALIKRLTEKGIAVIAASGNNSFRDSISAPACIPGVIAVGATDYSDRVAGFSNSAPMVDLLAPGTDRSPAKKGSGILSSIPGGGFIRMPGTSMAAPHVAGAFTLLSAASPKATVSEILEALKKSGVPVKDSNGLGKPRIRVDMALAMLPKGNTVQTPGEPGQKQNTETKQGQQKRTADKRRGTPAWQDPPPKPKSSYRDYGGIRVYEEKNNSGINADGSIRW